MSTPDTQFKLRLPADLKQKLERESEVAGRSLSAEIVHRLESSFSAASAVPGVMGLRAEIAVRRELANSTVAMLSRACAELVERRDNGGTGSYPRQAAGRTVEEALADAEDARDMFQRVVDAATLLLSELSIAEAKGEMVDLDEIRKRAKAWGVLH
ncbi:hypothetical protein ABB26_12475 [Stenotrophomonas humi]|uniref:Arc-like DNA binding domain-containing protein n=1 Tax=Stenotrophomonas humi TaxID=405444 RepID=A0A0R0CDX8_9GAMM|nr:Arc family DNA-binding protein [Stenotrophomonas humi]KRG63368.1 hypothetical protein ABB26_12475 [Stenotrophomonas humi]